MRSRVGGREGVLVGCGAGVGFGVPLEEVGLEVRDLRGDLRGEVIVTAGERAMMAVGSLTQRDGDVEDEAGGGGMMEGGS